MKIRHHRFAAQGLTNAAASNAQSGRRRRSGLATEPGEAHHSAEIEELLVLHRQHPTLKRKSTRRKHDVENPEEDHSELALETATMVLPDYTRETKSLIVKVHARQRRDQQGESGSNTQHDNPTHGNGRTQSVTNSQRAQRGLAMSATSLALKEMATHANLQWAQAKLVELAGHTRMAANAPNPVERALALMQLYLEHCAQRPQDAAPRTTLAAIREQLVAALQPPETHGVAARALLDLARARQLEHFNLFLPLWLLQLHRPRLRAHLGPAVARSHAICGRMKHLLA